MRHAVFLPPFGELAEPRAVAELARRAEGTGWDGFFLWDHILRPPLEPQDIADVWVTLSVVATVTERLRLGPMVTPLARRRPQVVARQAVTLDRASGGRLILGLGLGVDTSGELSRFGDPVDARSRGDLLDEGADLLVALWSGEPVRHRGAYFRAEDVQFLPRGVQEPHVPLWFAARGVVGRPLRRAARHQGVFAIELDTAGLVEALEIIRSQRGSLDGFDVAVRMQEHPDLAAAAAVGVTWALWSPEAGVTLGEVERRIDEGPPPSPARG
jgi:alkanesulfonate monooxygenase SsuD/methylene tetrahydromethanopterin reductase-like flavin-dependent oxidoreductase (luciferase family)